MKKLIIFFSVITITTAVFAQKAPDKKSEKAAENTPLKDGVWNKDGKVWYVKQMTGTMTLDNGVTAMTDGTIKLAGGKTFTLNNGDCINFQGTLIGLNQKSTVVDGLVMKRNDIMWAWSILKKPFQLKNGTYACADGTIRTADGKYTKLKKGEFVDLDGNTTMMSKKKPGN